MNGMADRRGDALLRAFARDLAKMRRDLRNLEAANQISSASIEGGTLDVYDDDDVLRERIGKQANGSYGRLVLEGPVPPIPSEPDVQVIADGVVAITWDGRCEEKWPFVEFEAVRVHLVSDPDTEVCDRDNQVGLILSHRGETIVAVTESDDDNPVYVRLVAVSSAGHVSDPSPAVLVDELDEDNLEDDGEELEWEDGDGYTLTQADVDAGTVTFGLSHIPEQKSLLAWIAGARQRPAAYVVDFDTPAITFELGGWEEADDEISLYYPYMNSGADTLVPFGAAGWKWLQVAASDSTDRSGTGYDDSAFATGTMPVSNTLAAHSDAPAEWLDPASASWATGTTLWVRRTVATSPGRELVVRIRVDNFVDVYWNGELIAANQGTPSGSPGWQEPDITIPGGKVLASNVLAVRARDDGGARVYLDMSVIA